MIATTGELLRQARAGRYAVGAFNVYNLEGALAVVGAAESMASPVILQILPKALQLAGSPLAALCLECARSSSIPVAVHLDHCSDPGTIDFAVGCGITSIMADGSPQSIDGNIAFTRSVVDRVKAAGGCVEGELGRLSGDEDGEAIGSGKALLTDPDEAVRFVTATGIDALAVCIGNVHGRYRLPPELDFARLAAIEARVTVPLVLHGTSGLPDNAIRRAVAHGVCKFNVNTELRQGCLQALARYTANPDVMELLPCMRGAIAAMREIVKQKIELFCSANRAALHV